VEKQDYYETLGVERGAAPDVVKSAYRKLAMKYHPDRNPGDQEAEDRFKAAAEAYSVLSDNEKRQRYDQFGHAGVGGAGQGGFNGGGFADASDIFGDIFGDLFGGGGRGGRSVRRGADLQYEIEVEFEDAVFGTKTEIKFPRNETCESCEGSGAKKGTQARVCGTCRGRGQVHVQRGFFAVSQPCSACRGAGKIIDEHCDSCRGGGTKRNQRTLKINIPAGVDDGTRLRLTGEGESGGQGGHPGDLYVLLSVKDHPVFHREERDLHCEVPVNVAQAALGAEIAVPTLEGEEKIHIKAGVQSGERFPLKGKGVPNVNGTGRRGDLIIHLKVATPEKLTKQQREHFEALRDLLPTDHSPSEKGVFERVRDFFN
jgi:molecular chaperone DnaJ